MTVSDSASAPPPRFAPYACDATVLAPWLARADQDTKWNSGEIQFRVLLIGDNPRMYAVNPDIIGAVIQLGDPPQGIQSWEVVCYFDWYLPGIAAKIGTYCWARPRQAPLPPPPPPPPTGWFFNNFTGCGTNDPAINLLNFFLDPRDETIWIWALFWDPACTITGLTIDGVGCTPLFAVAGDAFSPRMEAWQGVLSSAGAGAGVVNLSTGGPVELMIFGSNPDATLVGAVSQTEAIGATPDFNMGTAVLANNWPWVVCWADSPLGPFSFDAPWDNSVGFPSSIPTGIIRVGALQVPGASPIDAVMTTTTSTLWRGILLNLHRP